MNIGTSGPANVPAARLVDLHRRVLAFEHPALTTSERTALQAHVAEIDEDPDAILDAIRLLRRCPSK